MSATTIASDLPPRPTPDVPGTFIAKNPQGEGWCFPDKSPSGLAFWACQIKLGKYDYFISYEVPPAKKDAAKTLLAEYIASLKAPDVAAVKASSDKIAAANAEAEKHLTTKPPPADGKAEPISPERDPSLFKPPTISTKAPPKPPAAPKLPKTRGNSKSSKAQVKAHTPAKTSASKKKTSSRKNKSKK